MGWGNNFELLFLASLEVCIHIICVLLLKQSYTQASGWSGLFRFSPVFSCFGTHLHGAQRLAGGGGGAEDSSVVRVPDS